ncbi:dihydrofolate reductase [Microbacterium endophyticum]|uniref:Dihydrofolate reductase n=1 Tax=Microbacterium endophyticum TaxID=1526412 RepID=A0A7W4V3Z7_9MICO|nr:dihydrofolate reductase family protein [Microbacterium endophyticum]MBB2975860.1 dihydrofolate reductase [Microbacterium endophyticum]NIK36343.1 dihydrofolate reductase [Microbacterium endophyticum]
MPARFVYWMNVSLDLKIERDRDEDGSGDWMSIDEAIHLVFNARAAGLTHMVQGRKVYEAMEQYWPAVREDPSQPAFARAYGEIWTSMPKTLVSRSRTNADYNTQIIGDRAMDRLAALRAESTGDIGVGGADVASQMLLAGLLDELLLFTHPVILGRGRPVFDAYDEPIKLNLLEQAAYPGGVTMHRYAIDYPAVAS